MKARCRPGDRCVIVVDGNGCECNIGATLTVTERIPLVSPPAWAFKDASRPLKMVGLLVHDDGTTEKLKDPPVSWVTASGPVDADHCCGFFDSQLVPVRDLGEDTAVQADKPAEVPA